MKPFRVTGKFVMGRTQTPFTVETVGKDPEAAKERVLSTIGSRHRVDRHHIKISNIEEISPDQVTDAVVEKRLEMNKGA